MKNNKLSTQFLINYILLFLLICFLIFITYIYFTSSLVSLEEKSQLDVDKFIDDYYNYSLSYAYNSQPLTDKDYIEVIDESYTILESINSPNKKGYVYSAKEYSAKFFNSLNPAYIMLDIENSSNFILIYLEPITISNSMILKILLFFIVIFIIAIICFTKYSTQKIIFPIQKILQGVKQIANGNYDTKIEFDSSNELDDLKNTLNTLCTNLKNEIALKEKSNIAQKHLIRNISHDLKTPLTNIVGYSEFALLDLSNVNETKNLLEIIHSNGLLADKLILELSELSILESNILFDTSKHNLCEFMRKFIIKYLPIFEVENINYNIVIPDTPIWVELNTSKFERALNNIIHNSIKYNKNNFSIEISLVANKNNAILSIKDSGIGVSNEFAPYIFEAFSREDLSRNNLIKGSGIGLSITKKYIELHGGNISLDETNLNGCKFDISLPIV